MLSNLNKKPYILKTTLEPNQIYSCFGIKIKVKEQVDTFSNKGNFSIHINNINLKALKSQSHNTITKDTPLFCYVQESNQTHIVKLQDSTTSINIQLNKNLPKDSNGNLIPIIPKLIFLSFIPFRDSKEANNSPSQKISLTADDINKNYINVDFKIPLKYLGEWQNIKTHKLQQIKSNKSKEIISIKFNGKTLQILEKGEAKQEFTFKAQSGDNGNKETMIEEGNYYIKANEVIEANIINNVNIDINQFNLGNKYIKLHKNTSDKNIADKNTSNNNTANKNTSNKETSNKKTLKDDSLLTKALNLVKIQSTAYTIHGGKSYGDNKGIDLATQDLAFFKALQKLTNKYKIELENANNEIRVEVGYEKQAIVILDAGHGGTDGGASRNSVNEKDLTLSIVKKLHTKLLNNYEVYMTRDSDKFISIKERYKLANKKHTENPDKAILFISIHINSSSPDSTTSRGIEVLYYDHKNYKIDGNNATKQQINKTEKSIQFGQKLRSKFSDFILRTNFIYHQDKISVIKMTTMPAVLIECGFINNADDRLLLQNDDYQYKLALAIKEAIDEYFS